MLKGTRKIPPENIITQVLACRNMKQVELAKRVGIKREYLNRIINRKITPSVVLGMRIAKVLDKKVEGIFFEGR